jgi:hypothetical protein
MSLPPLTPLSRPILHYKYPPANLGTCMAMAKELAENKLLYTRVLHLMNSMNLSAPFVQEYSEEQLNEDVKVLAAIFEKKTEAADPSIGDRHKIHDTFGVDLEGFEQSDNNQHILKMPEEEFRALCENQPNISLEMYYTALEKTFKEINTEDGDTNVTDNGSQQFLSQEITESSRNIEVHSLDNEQFSDVSNYNSNGLQNLEQFKETEDSELTVEIVLTSQDEESSDKFTYIEEINNLLLPFFDEDSYKLAKNVEVAKEQKFKYTLKFKNKEISELFKSQINGYT